MDEMPSWDTDRVNGESDTPDHQSDWTSAIPVALINDGMGYSLCPGPLALPPEVGAEADGDNWVVMTTLPGVEVGFFGATADVPTIFLMGCISSGGKLCLKLATQPDDEGGTGGDSGGGEGEGDAGEAADEYGIPLCATSDDMPASGHVASPLVIGGEGDRPARPITARPLLYVRLDSWRQYHIWAAIIDHVLYAWTDDSWFGITNVEDYFISQEIGSVPGSIYQPITVPGDIDPGISDYDPDTDDDLTTACPLSLIGGADLTGGPILPRLPLRLGSCWIGDMGLEGGSQIMTRREHEITDDYGFTQTVSEIAINESLPWVRCCTLPMPWTSITWGRELTLSIYGVYHAGTYVFRAVEM